MNSLYRFLKSLFPPRRKKERDIMLDDYKAPPSGSWDKSIDAS